MKYVDRLIQETDYLKYLKRLEMLESEREFCRHGLPHLLDTARIAWIWCLEWKYEIEKEILYLAALLHDLGRIQEYEASVPHEEAGVILAKHLLEEITYPEEKRERILEAIQEHRSAKEGGLCEILYQADKKSRNCFYCEAQEKCKWEREKRNQTVQV